MNATITDIWGYEAAVGTVASPRCSAAHGLHRPSAAIASMPSTFWAPATKAVKRNGTRRRPSEGST